ncbi:MAG: DUF3179 domain-containing protein [Acidimicrobiia bacterium]|nr:DUF3179 domain-containing protein [Acidimicrobiia bacterium]
MRMPLMVLLFAGALAAQLAPGNWKTDLSKKSIDLGELKSGGPPKDGIPAIDRPRFDTVDEAARWLHPREPIMVVNLHGEARAYPLQVLTWHELVNDQIGDTPLLASFCPLCNSAIVFDRRLDGTVYDFGVSGMLRHSDMVMYDRQTDSLWQQITGEAIVGELTGKTLTILPSQTVSFETFAAGYPQGKVLNRDTGHMRPYGQNPYERYEFNPRLVAPIGRVELPANVRPMERLVTITIGDRTRAYTFHYVRSRKVVEDSFQDIDLVIFYDKNTLSALDSKQIKESQSVGSVGVFCALVDGNRLRFRHRKDGIEDKQTKSRWNVLGVATEGPLKGKRLKPVDHGVYFAFAWLVFRPETRVIGDSGLRPGTDPFLSGPQPQ